MAHGELTKAQYVPLTCHGHSRPVVHLSFSGNVGRSEEEEFYMISACKDNNPMLRDGLTGDWIGTFFGHKGAVYQARLSPDASLAATASADFTARVWDTHTGETFWKLQHEHVVRAVAFPPNSGDLLATGGMDKKLRIFDLSVKPSAGNTGIAADKDNAKNDPPSYEIGAGVHRGAIKAVVWTHDSNFLVTAADDGLIRWWNLTTGAVVQELKFEGAIGTCEFSGPSSDTNDIGNGLPVLSIAAGKTVFFYGGPCASTLLKKITLPYAVTSVALHAGQRKFVTGEIKNPWVHVHNYDTEEITETHKGHHGPIWSIAFSPDGKLYATGSEDGTIKMWKNTPGPYGLWRADRDA